MSSSKIIKQTVEEQPAITEYCFKDIGREGVTAPELRSTGRFEPLGLAQGSDSFVPMNMRWDGSPEEGEDASHEEVVEEGPPTIEIEEEELNRRISDAFDSGVKDGKELAERGLINVFRALRASSESIHHLREKILRESEDEILNLVMLIARKVIVREVDQDRSILAGVVQNALSGMSARDEITVRINPEDYQLVTSGRDEVICKELLNERLLLKPDPSIAAGFCQVNTEMGTIDASLDGQLDQIYRSLLDRRTLSTVEE